MATNVLGLNVWSHDTSACLVSDGELVCAVEEERFIGEKHTTRFPENAIRAVLGQRSLGIQDVDAICVGWDMERLVRYQYLRPAMDNGNEMRSLPQYFSRLSNFLSTESIIRARLGFQGDVAFVEHHLAHSCFASYSAGVDTAMSVVVDGYGDRETISVFRLEQGRHTLVHGWDFPSSIGLVYTAVTEYLGFRRNCDEGIVMGLAAYGDPHAPVGGSGETHIEAFRRLVPDDEAGVFRVDASFFPFGNFRQGFFTRRFEELFGPRRADRGPVTDAHRHVAAALQMRAEEILENVLVHAERYGDTRTVLLSGGVALNCVANAKLTRGRGTVARRAVMVPQNPGDAGVAIGAALHYCREKAIPVRRRPLGSLGPAYPAGRIASAAQASGGRVSRPADLLDTLAERLRAGRICALYQGGSEFGPRALGHRSILTAPYPAAMKDHLNKRVKFREDFRPFAPMVREEQAAEYFEIDYPSPFMMHAVPVVPARREQIAAVVHVDGTGRVQTVNRDDSPFIYALLGRFGEKTGVPIILNTSFNVKGQPIVETPEQAVETFERTNIECLVMPPYCIDKADSGEGA